MKLQILYIFLLYPFFSCSTFIQNTNYKKEDFIKYENTSLSILKADSEEIQDIYFEILLHKELNKILKSSSGDFQHLFYFKRNQFISTLYIPRVKNISNLDASNLTYDDFIKILKENNLEYYFDNCKFKKNRIFGIKKVNNNFYVIYLNVISEQIDKFNYSINSIKL